MNEKDILNLLKQSADDLTPPEALRPEAIEKMLKKKQKPQRKFWSSAVRFGSLAAVFALVIGIVWQSNQNIRSGENTSSNVLEQYDETAALAITEGSDEHDLVDTTVDTLAYADSYEEIYESLRDNFYYSSEVRRETAADGTAVLESMRATGSTGNDTTADIAVENTVEYEMAVSEEGTAEEISDYSDTNRQEEGVDEADIIKTDGSYIYILRRDGSFVIVHASVPTPELISITDLPTQGEQNIQELYLDGDILSVITNEYVSSLSGDEDVFYSDTTDATVIYTYDISDRSDPILTGTVIQEGYYTDSRKTGQYLYLFSSYYPDIQDTYENSSIIPRINGTVVSADDFYLPPSLESSTCLVISSVDITQPNQIVDSKVLVSGASHFYVSTESIYITQRVWTNSSERTEITRFRYQDGMISGVAAGSVKGYLNDSFSLNEYNGNLRVVSTYYGTETTQVREAIGALIGYDLTIESDWEEHNGLYVFNENMQQIGKIEDLAPGETIRSARFFGDTGYFVTFRQTDPLFSVDISDPTNPQILGELKISGFSSYLHFYGENQLLGIGYEADENTGITTGLKLSMFDISDPANVTESHRFVIPGITWCPAIDDYKAILVDPAKNVIGFYCDNRYLIFSHDPKTGFVQELIYDFYSDQLTGSADYYNMRGLFIGDTLYLAGESFVITFDMKDGFVKNGILRLEA